MEYPSREFKQDIKESEGNVFNPIFNNQQSNFRHLSWETKFFFQFQYTDGPSVYEIINNLKPKSSTEHDNISSKLLRGIGDIVTYSLSIIVN